MSRIDSPGIAVLLQVSSAPKAPKIVVLLATYNGSAFLREQLDSLAAQTLKPTTLMISDDGSSDSTLSIIAAWSTEHPEFRVVLERGPTMGFAENFRNLILNAPVDADFAAFCDQDDIWMPHKLETAVSTLSDGEPDEPKLFCGRTRNFPAKSDQCMSPLFQRPPSFNNALVQSIAGGNTMVLNNAGMSTLREATKRTGFISHDWWSYLIISGVGGVVHYCAEPLVNYRQHDDNLVGSNTDWRARFHRIKMMSTGRFKLWNDRNIAALEACSDLLTHDARTHLDAFKKIRSGNVFQRVIALWNSGLYRQSIFGQMALYAACIIRRL